MKENVHTGRGTNSIEKIHLIFKTHLDIGFTDFAANVIVQYFTHFIPTALDLASQFRCSGTSTRFIWTTGSWLIYEYLEKAPPAEKLRMEEAIVAGDIVWHALPFTTHSELMDTSLFEYGLSLSSELDQRFSKKTIAAKMTDVPGHTRGIVSLLAKAGVKFLHIGVNPASTSPDVPPVFVWQDVSKADIIVMYHKGSYGDLMVVPGMTDAIAFVLSTDNLGPPSAEHVLGTFQHFLGCFPGTSIFASTMDAFAHKLLHIKPHLPVVTNEIGDTWIHGVGTDPKKVSQFRELCRLRRQWLINGMASIDDRAAATFSRFLLMVPEHTWGMDEKTYLHDYVNYDPDHFRAARTQDNFRTFEASWREQRDYLHQALDALGKSQLAELAEDHLHSIEPVLPSNAHLIEISNWSQLFETTHFIIGFDTKHGALTHLQEKTTGRNWASPTNTLALFHYETFSQKDYDHFYHKYITNKKETAKWSTLDFTKPGMGSSKQEHISSLLPLAKMYTRQEKFGHYFLLELNRLDEDTKVYGCPHKITIEITLPCEEPALYLDFQWFDKRASRLPEALWLSFCPKVLNPKGWRMEKMGQSFSPYEVIRNGNRTLHALETSISYQDKKARLTLETLDAPLVAPGIPSLLQFTNRQPALRNGWHFNLYNNVWGTNFPMWYEEDAKFRFVMRFDKVKR